jgi:hypothetical protein
MGPFGTILETSRSFATVGSWTPWYLVSLQLHSRCRMLADAANVVDLRPQ